MLFSPFELNKMQLMNRIIAAPIVSNSGNLDGTPNERSVQVYENYARSGAGLVVIEQHAVHPWGRNKATQFRLDSDEKARSLQVLTRSFQTQNIPVVAQLNFSGAGASGRELPEDEDFELVSPSGLRNPRDLINADSRALKYSEIQEIIESFANAAKRAVHISGYTGGVQIYGCHGYLLGQFLSPLTNKRTDSYGGQLKNRARLLYEIVEAVRGAVPDALLSVRLGVSDTMPGKVETGLTLSEGIQIADELSHLGIDWLGVSGNHCIFGIGEDDNDTAYFSSYAKAIKEGIKMRSLPIDCTGGIRTRKTAQRLLDEDVCDLIGIGRPLLLNPQFIQTL